MASKRVISVDIGSTSIKAVSGRIKDGSTDITKAVIANIPADCYEDGIIKNRAEFANWLEEIFINLDPKCKDIVVSYDGSHVFRREIVISKVNPEDIIDLVSAELSGDSAFDISKYILQYKETGSTEDGKLKLRVYGVPENSVREIYSVIGDMGYHPVKMELNPNGIENLYQDMYELRPQEYTAFIDLDADYSGFTFFEKGHLVRREIIDTGIRIFDTPLSGIMEAGDTVERMRDEIKVAEIWRMSRKGEFSSYEMSDEERELIDGIVQKMDEFLEDIVLALRMDTERDGSMRPDHIYIYGDGSMMPQICEALEERLGIPVFILDYDGDEGLRKPGLFVNTAMAMTGKMNFFDSLIVDAKTKWNKSRLLLFAAIFVVLFGMLYLTVDRMMKEAALKSELSSLRQQLEDSELNAAIARVQEKEVLLQKLLDLNRLIMSAEERHKNSNMVDSALIHFINAQIPDKVFLKAISVDGTTIVISGVAEGYEDYAQFVYNLDNTGKFKKIQMGTIEKIKDGQGFEIIMERVMGAIDEGQ